ncbi:MAG: CSLREA domain-containing protein, partial [Actinomycetota bacterium]
MSAPWVVRLLGTLLAVSSVATIGVWSAPTVSAGQFAFLASVIVDTTEDTFDGSCDDTDCSLRDAVKSAPVGARVLVPPGLYALSRSGRGGVGIGSIELRRRVEIVGAGETGAFIDASALGAPAFVTSASSGTSPRFTIDNLTLFGARDAALVGGAIRAEGGRLRLVGSTLTGGIAERGGGIAVEAGAGLRVVDTLMTGNQAVARGGAIWNEGSVRIVDSAIVKNAAGDGGGVGSAEGAAMSLRQTTVALNTAGGRGGGLWLAGPAVISFATLGDNEAAVGGGIAVAGSAAGAVEVGASIVAGNRAGTFRQCSG